MPSVSTFDEDLGYAIRDFENRQEAARGERQRAEARFEAARPAKVSKAAWLRGWRVIAARGLWNERHMRAEARTAAKTEEACHRVYSRPTRTAIYTDGDGNWFSEESADMADEAAYMYRELAERWGEYADFWEALAEKFEADPAGIPALVLGTGGTRS